MHLDIHPPTGVGPLRFGMEFTEAADLVSEWGEVKVAEPAQGWTAFKAVVVHPDFEVVLLVDDGRTLTGVEAWRFEHDTADVTVEFDGMDVFRMPAREVVARLTEAGHDADTSDEEVAVFPNLALLLSRETSRDVELDDTDGFPLHFHYVLAAPGGYFG